MGYWLLHVEGLIIMLCQQGLQYATWVNISRVNAKQISNSLYNMRTQITKLHKVPNKIEISYIIIRQLLWKENYGSMINPDVSLQSYSTGCKWKIILKKKEGQGFINFRIMKSGRNDNLKWLPCSNSLKKLSKAIFTYWPPNSTLCVNNKAIG